MIKCDKGNFEIKGVEGQIQAEFEIILRETRKFFIENDGEEAGKKKFDEIIKLSELPDKERADAALNRILKTLAELVLGSSDGGNEDAD